MATVDVIHPDAPAVPRTRVSERTIGLLYGGTALAVIGLMGIAGLVMRFTQADVLDVPPDWFYRLMTLHGAGMITGTLVGMMGALWVTVRPVIHLSVERMLAAWALIVAGVAAVLLATLGGGFAGGWTFLYPLPFDSAGQWDTWATAAFLCGMLLVGAGFMVFCVDVLMRATAVYGSLLRALGIQYLRNRDDSPPPPPALAAVVVAIDGLLASAIGTTVVVAELGRTFDDRLTMDALWAKNLTFFFGHSVANLVIYLAAGALYVLVPRYAGRPWKTTKPIVVGWLATLVFVATAYSHHLYMDFVQPQWAAYVSLTASMGAALPVLVITVYTGLMLIWGSRYRWTLASTLLYVGFAGWVIGGLGAVIDAVIPLNFRFHNTLWVVAHFHTYMLMGVVIWVVAWVTDALERAAGRVALNERTAPALAAMLVGGFGLVGMWYVSGALGLPRRYAVQPIGTDGYSLAGALFATVFAIGLLVIVLELASLGRTALAGGALSGFGTRDAEPPSEDEGPRGLPLERGWQVIAALVAAALALIALFPQVTDAVEGETRYHHLQHAAVYFLGVMLGLVLGSAPETARRLGQRLPGVALTLAVAGPVAMMLMMTPSVYTSLDENSAVHLAYHLGVVAIGIVTGFAAAGLGRVTGTFVALLAVGMALMYAAGVTG
ncbi:MAG TPA: cbb3-type cytochrome c oxidase subunit I [Gaiella sp.]|nr:cbb3-type cytochrome c oxidase subunit I [Gaiella sp.]